MHALSLLALAGAVSAHYQLLWPQPSGTFVDETEGEGPCGGQTPIVNSTSTMINVAQFSVAIRNSHPKGNFRFSATLSTSAPYNWTEITPDIQSTGLGTFCSQGLYAPSSFAGQAGIIQVIENAGHGTLYQCAPVNFVSTGGDTPGNTCSNSSSASIVWAAASSNNASTASTGSTSTTSSSPASAVSAATSSTRTGAAPTMTMGGVVAGLGMVAAGLLI